MIYDTLVEYSLVPFYGRAYGSMERRRLGRHIGIYVT